MLVRFRSLLSALLLACVCAALVAPASSPAAVTWRGEEVLSNSNDWIYSARVASDASNNAIAVWVALDNIQNIQYSDIKMGGSWSAPKTIPGTTGADNDPEKLQIVMSPNGRVVVTFQRDNRVWFSKRVAGSTTFSTPVALGAAGTGTIDRKQSVAVNDNGRIVVAWEHEAASMDVSVQVVRSSSFGTPTGLQNISGINSYHPTVGIDGAGNAIMFYSKKDLVGDEDDMMVARSTAGAAFGAPSVFDTAAAPASDNDSRPQVAVNPDGEMVAAWEAQCTAAEPGCIDYFVRGVSGDTTGSTWKFKISNPLLHAGKIPQVAIDEIGWRTIAWLKNDSSDSRNQIMATTSNGGSYRESVSLGSPFVGDEEFAVSTAGGRGLVTYLKRTSEFASAQVAAHEGSLAGNSWGTSTNISSTSSNTSLPHSTYSAGGRAIVVFKDHDDNGLWTNSTSMNVPINKQPILYVPGVMGSELKCGPLAVWAGWKTDLLFFNSMWLKRDGKTNWPGPCNSYVRATGALTPDNDAMFEWMEGQGHEVWGFGYDWRRSPDQHMTAFHEKILDMRRVTGSNKVIIVSYSMGGLLSQMYIKDATKARNISRLITVATPYWGSIRPWMPVSHGWTLPSIADGTAEEIAKEIAVDNDEMQDLARNLSGPYSLFPSDNLNTAVGGWLSVDEDLNNSHHGRKTPHAQVGAVAERVFGANGNLIRAAQALHRTKIDGFKKNGVDYHAIVSSGLPTAAVAYEWAPWGFPVTADYTYLDGDTVVTSASQTQGTNPFSASPNPLGDNVKFHIVCRGPHGAGADELTKPFLVELLAKDSNFSWKRNPSTCNASGTWYEIRADAPTPPGGSGSAQKLQGIKVPAALRKLITDGKITLLPGGSGKIVIVTHGEPISSLPLSTDTLVITKLGLKNGKFIEKAQSWYDPKVDATKLAFTKTGFTIKSKGKSVKKRPPEKKQPTVSFKTKTKGKMVTITVNASDASGIAKIYYIIGSGDPETVTGKTFKVKKALLKKVRVIVVDEFGNPSKPKKVV